MPGHLIRNGKSLKPSRLERNSDQQCDRFWQGGACEFGSEAILAPRRCPQDQRFPCWAISGTTNCLDPDFGEAVVFGRWIFLPNQRCSIQLGRLHGAQTFLRIVRFRWFGGLVAMFERIASYGDLQASDHLQASGQQRSLGAAPLTSQQSRR